MQGVAIKRVGELSERAVGIGLKVWLNGRKIDSHHPQMGRWLQPDDDTVPIELRAGLNDLLVKIEDGSGDYGFVVQSSCMRLLCGSVDGLYVLMVLASPLCSFSAVST